ncbi:MAG: M20 family metallopeptidase [Spirosomataceae bacterium]
MKKAIALTFVFASLIGFAQTTQTMSSTKQKEAVHLNIKLETDKIFDKLVEIRRKLHQNPELAGKEKITQQTLKSYLENLGLEVKTDIYGHGLVGILKGAKSGKNIAWRADMDALPQDFPDRATFHSQINGVQHGCGHDIHMAIALGIAEVLSKNKNKLSGSVAFIFQPEEETFLGAKNMIEKGLFKYAKPSEIYGLHVTALPVGQIMVKPNELFAYQKGFRIAMKNKLSKVEIQNLKTQIRNLLTRFPDGNKPWELQHIIDPKHGLSTPNTIYKDYLFMDERFFDYAKNDTLYLEGELYETNASSIPNILPSIKKLISDSGYAFDLMNVSFTKENPTVLNNPQLTNEAIVILDRIYGKGFTVNDYGYVPFFNDDFAYFQQKVPGVYFLLGGSNFEKGMIAMNHAPNFEVDEECIRIGVKCFSSLIFERLLSVD